MKSLLTALFRCRHPTEQRFIILLSAMILTGLVWLLFHAGVENREALVHWLKVMAGDTTLGLRTADYLRGGLMVTALVWVLVGAGLLVSRSWWCFEFTPSELETETGGRRDWRFFAGLGLIVLMALAICWPRMELSLYNDEASWFRTAVEGEFDNKAFFDLESEALPRFRETSWMETFWGNRLANNHELQSVMARPLYELWSKIHGSPEGTIHEWPLRIPALLGGMLAVVAVGLLGANLSGRSRVGLVAAFLLAIQPWHLRYATEARGYALAMGFAALTAFFLMLAIRSGRWRWWIAYGLSQTVLLWSYLGSIYLLFGINLITLLLMVGQCFVGPKRINPFRSEAIRALLVVNALSACLFFFLQAPNVAALRFAMEANPTFQRGPGPTWWPDVLGYLFAGMPWHDADPGNEINPAITKYLGSPLVVVGLAAGVALLLTGIVHLLRRGGIGGWIVVLGPALAVFLAWMVGVIGESSVLKWYVSYAVVFPPLWMAVGLNALVFRSRDTEANGGTTARLTWQRMATYGLLGLWAIAIARPLTLYRNYPKLALRPAIELIRGGVYPFDDPETQLDPIVVGWWTTANIYDPYFRIVHRPDRLETVVQKARRENRPLYFVLGMRSLAITEREDGKPVGRQVVKRLEKSGEFETVRVFPGLEEEKWRVTVFRLKNEGESG